MSEISNPDQGKKLIRSFQPLRKLVRGFKDRRKLLYLEEEQNLATKILLYRDNDIIHKIHAQITAEAFQKESRLQKIKKVIKRSQLTLRDWEDADEIVFSKTNKFSKILELGSNIQLKWNMDNENNLDIIIYTLVSAMWNKRLGVSEVTRRIRNQKSDSSLENLIYPGMPVNLFGILRNKDNITPETITIHEFKSSAKIAFAKEHKLSQAFNFLRRRPIYVIGVIESIETTPTVKAGTILLGEK